MSYLSHPLDGDSEHSVSSLTVQCHLQLNLIISNRQRILDIQVAATIKDWLHVTKYSRVCLDHGLDDLSVDSSWTLVWYNGYLVVVDEASWHGDLKVVCSQDDGSTLASQVRSPRTLEDWTIR